MPRPRRRKIRFNLEVAPEVRANAELLKAATGADSLTEVVRRSLVVHLKLVTMVANGETVLIRDRNGVERELVLV